MSVQPSKQKQQAGSAAYHAGLAAEDIVSNFYSCHGLTLRETRWRGRCGEIDLIFTASDGLVFVEVKKARTFDLAAERLTPRQLQRIALSAQDYVGNHTDDPLTPFRLDLAMVDEQGRVDILKNLALD